MFPDKSARGVRRCSSSKGTPWARKRKTSFILRFSTRTSILCVYSIDCLSVFAHPCTYILSPASNLAPSDARLEPHDRSIFPVASRTRYHRIRSDSRALGLAAFLPFSVLWPFYFSSFRDFPTRERLGERLVFRIRVRSKVLRSKLGSRVGRKEGRKGVGSEECSRRRRGYRVVRGQRSGETEWQEEVNFAAASARGLQLCS